MSRLKPTILCVDDHWNGLIGRKIFLENNGYEVLEATGGDEGLKLFRSTPLKNPIPGRTGVAEYHVSPETNTSLR